MTPMLFLNKKLLSENLWKCQIWSWAKVLKIENNCHWPHWQSTFIKCSNEIQWAPLNGITGNGINRIIESLLGSFSQSHQLENWLVHWKKEFGYRYHSLIGIRYGLAQSDPIKWCLLKYWNEINWLILSKGKQWKLLRISVEDTAVSQKKKGVISIRIWPKMTVFVIGLRNQNEMYFFWRYIKMDLFCHNLKCCLNLEAAIKPIVNLS